MGPGAGPLGAEWVRWAGQKTVTGNQRAGGQAPALFFIHRARLFPVQQVTTADAALGKRVAKGLKL